MNFVGALDAEKSDAAVLLYVFIGFPTSLFEEKNPLGALSGFAFSSSLRRRAIIDRISLVPGPNTYSTYNTEGRCLAVWQSTVWVTGQIPHY